MMNPSEIEKLNAQFASATPEALLEWAWRVFGRRVVLASSFGVEDALLIDAACKVSKEFRIFTLDTGRLPEETYQVMDAMRHKYGAQIETFFPDRQKVEELESAKGFYSFRESVENRKECCGIRKVEPLRRALTGQAAWITGLRREQSVTRTDIRKIEWDASWGGMLKISPLADWTEAEVWEYVKKNNIPYNRLHDQGYPSIGCAPCTRAVGPGEDARAGRWSWERSDHKECGLHTRKL